MTTSLLAFLQNLWVEIGHVSPEMIECATLNLDEDDKKWKRIGVLNEEGRKIFTLLKYKDAEMEIKAEVFELDASSDKEGALSGYVDELMDQIQVLTLIQIQFLLQDPLLNQFLHNPLTKKVIIPLFRDIDDIYFQLNN